MKLIIAGSRTIENIDHLYKAIEKYIPDFSVVTEIVSGAARGADRLGEIYGKAHKIPVNSMPAEWDKYGKSAGYRRNEEMAKYADACLVLWDGKSRGSQHMINLARQYNLPTWVYNVSENA